MSVRVSGLDQARALIAGVGDKMPTVVLYAQINAAEKAKTAEQQEIRNIFDRPTPLIVEGMRVIIDKTTREVAVGWKDVYGGPNEPTLEHRGRLYSDAVSRTLIPHIEGGIRPPKPWEARLRRAGVIGANEYLVPARTAPFDAYGNIRGSLIQKMLSDIGVYGYSEGSGNTGRDKKAFMVGKVKGARGIYRIKGGVDNAKTGRWDLMFLIVSRAPSYRRRFRFYETAIEAFNAVWRGEFDRVFARELGKAGR